MKRIAPIQFCVGFLLLNMASAYAQRQILSFEPGGHEACANALHRNLPDPNENDRSFSYACEERDVQIEKSEFAELNKTMAAKSPKERNAFAALMAAFTKYRAAYVEYVGKACEGGIGCGLEMKDAEDVSNYNFLKMAEGFPREDFPSFSAKDFAREDAALNTAHTAALRGYFDPCTDGSDQCVSPEDIRKTERAWLRYRDAWAAFGTLRWPQVTAVSWRTYLTRERTKQLPYRH